MTRGSSNSAGTSGSGPRAGCASDRPKASDERPPCDADPAVDLLHRLDLQAPRCLCRSPGQTFMVNSKTLHEKLEARVARVVDHGFG